MKIIVCGGRDFCDRKLLFEFLDQLHTKSPITLLIHGGAKGADTLAGEWAFERRITVQVHRADWSAHGKAAGPIRNREMLATKPDFVVASPGGKGTADMIKAAKSAGVPVAEVAPL